MRNIIIAIISIVMIWNAIDVQAGKTVKSLLEKPIKCNTKDKIGKAIAKVNGVQVSRKEFLRVLYSSSGLRVLRQFIGLKLAEQLAREKGIALTRADFDKELIRVVSALGPKKGVRGKELTYDDRLKLLNVVLKRKGMSYDEFFIGIKTQAYLKAIVRKEIKITDDMLKREYQRIYGRKVHIRAIVVTNLQLAEKILQELQEGKEFSYLAKKYSVLPSGPISGGLIKNVSRYDDRLPALVVECAFKLSLGKISSPIKVDENFWIIKIEKSIPAKKIKYETVKDKLKQKLYNELEIRMARQLETDLIKQADIEIYNKQLKRDFSNWREKILEEKASR